MDNIIMYCGYFEQLKEIMYTIFKDLSSEDLYKDSKKIGKCCGKYYWTIPSTLNADECQKLYQNIHNRQKLDHLFINHLTKNKEKNLKLIKNNFINNKNLEKYHKSYRQAFKAYHKKMYLSSVMILIAIFEGICAEYVFNRKNNTSVQNSVNQYLNNKCNNKSKLLISQDKEALKYFIDSLFHTIDFDSKATLRQFNRHIIMHGRWLNQIGKRENLQIFNAIDQLLFFIKL